MNKDKTHIEARLKEIEGLMQQPDFWADKDQAQAIIQEMNDLKDDLEGVGKFDKSDAVMTIFAGAGGDDAEDFVRMLYEMYVKYIGGKGWGMALVHENQNPLGGYRNITIEISGKNAYGTLKNESGVHRLVRISPFNAKKQRHTAFAMVEVIPKFDDHIGEIDLPESDLRIEFSKSSGPGGQNANKRETAVRVVHIPTNISAHSEMERSQERNKEKAISMVKAKIYRKMEENLMEEKEGMFVSKTTEAEWGSQIRSYVLHPYKMVKDHRTNVEVRDTEGVLENGALDEFIEAEKEL